VLTLLVVYAGGFCLTALAVTLLARRHGSTGPHHASVYAALWPVALVGLVLSAAVFAPLHLAARRRERRGR